MVVDVDTTPELVNKVTIRLDGIDVTTQCVAADDEAGLVVLVCRDMEHHSNWRVDGPAHVVPDAGEMGVCKLTAKGFVTIQRKFS